MSSDEPSLRMGKQVDEGNVDYLKDRNYGGFPWTVTTPASIPEVKAAMRAKGIQARMVEGRAHAHQEIAGGGA
jgi:hypothetical protein